jgi:hypothetical protein
VEASRVAEGLTVKAAMEILGLSRSSYYRQVRGMTDYKAHARKTESMQHAEVLREVALKRGGSGTPAGESLCDGVGEALPGQSRQQSNELLPSAKEGGIDPTQAYWP